MFSSKKSSFHMPKEMVLKDINCSAMANQDDLKAFEDWRHDHVIDSEDSKKRFWVNHMLENAITSPQLRDMTRGVKLSGSTLFETSSCLFDLKKMFFCFSLCNSPNAHFVLFPISPFLSFSSLPS